MSPTPAPRSPDDDEPPDPLDQDTYLKTFAGKLEVADLFRRLLIMCLPPKATYGGQRRFHAGYHRMVALTYRLAPELFMGMHQDELALSLGITRQAFLRQLKYVDRMLAARRAK